MTRGYVLITVAVGKLKGVARDLKGLMGIKSVHVVTGPYDIIAFVEAKDLSSLTKTVVDGIHKVKGVIDTNTAIVVEY